MKLVARAFSSESLEDLDGAVAAFVRDGGPTIGVRLETMPDVARRIKKRYDRAWDRMFTMFDRRDWAQTLELTAKVRDLAAAWGDHWQTRPA